MVSTGKKLGVLSQSTKLTLCHHSRADPFPIEVVPRGPGIKDLILKEQAEAWESLRECFCPPFGH